MQIGHYSDGYVARASACRVETCLDARRFDAITEAKSVETILDAADTSVRATKARWLLAFMGCVIFDADR